MCLTHTFGQFLGSGTYDLEIEEKNEAGEVIGRYKPRYVDLYSTGSGAIRYSITKDCVLPDDLAMGEYVIGKGDAKNAVKVVSARAVGSVKVQFASIERQGVANGRAPEGVPEALTAA